MRLIVYQLFYPHILYEEPKKIIPGVPSYAGSFY